MTEIIRQIHTIRDFINQAPRQKFLLSNLKNWHMLCSSMDAVEDTEIAIEAYLNREVIVTDDSNRLQSVGESYLLVSGIMQVLIIQQDASNHIAESLGLKFESDQLLKNIREIRNDSIGHPTKRGQGISFNFIQQTSIAPSGFTLVTTYPNDFHPKYTHVDIPKLVVNQRLKLGELLGKIIQKLVLFQVNG